MNKFKEKQTYFYFVFIDTKDLWVKLYLNRVT